MFEFLANLTRSASTAGLISHPSPPAAEAALAAGAAGAAGAG